MSSMDILIFLWFISIDSSDWSNLLKLSIEFFFSLVLAFSSILKQFLFLHWTTHFVHPLFSYFCLEVCLSLLMVDAFLRGLFWILSQFTALHFFRSVTGAFWVPIRGVTFTWFFVNFVLVYTHRSKQSLLPDFIGSLCQGKTFSRHSSLRSWRYQLVVSVGRLPCYQALWFGGQCLCPEIESELTHVWVGLMAELHTRAGPLLREGGWSSSTVRRAQ